MKNCSVIWYVLLVWVVVQLCAAAQADAMTAFSRKYKIECVVCHTKLPDLNAFGLAFMKNDFKIPGKEGSTKEEKGEQAPTTEKDAGGERELKHPEEAKGAPAGKIPSSTPSGETAGTQAESAPKLAPVEEFTVFRSVGRDGTVIFSENPWRKDRVADERKKQVIRPPSKRSGRAGLGGVHATTTVKRSQIAKKSTRSMASVSVPGPVVRYRSYAECMEARLLMNPTVESAQQAMQTFMDAERSCERYPHVRR